MSGPEFLESGAPIYARIPRSVLRNTDLSAGARLLYAILDDHTAKDSRTVWPSQETMAGLMGCSVRSVRNYLNELASIEVIERRRTGQGKSDVVVVHWPVQTGKKEHIQTGKKEHIQTGKKSAPKKNHSRRTNEEALPYPSQEGDQPALDLDDSPPTQARKRQRTQDAAAGDMVIGWTKALFEHWPDKTKRGKPDAARRALAKALGEGWLPSEFQDRLDGYKRALAAFEGVTGQRPSVKSVGPWINELAADRRIADGDLWTQEVYDVEWLSGRWPAPRGDSWDEIRGRLEGQGTGRHLTMQELLALEAAGELDGADHG